MRDASLVETTNISPSKMLNCTKHNVRLRTFLWQHVTSKRPLRSQSANESSATDYDTWYEDQ